jgi:hypothetical protein
MVSAKSDNAYISEFLFNLEGEMELFSWTVDGVPVWEYIRVPIHRRILEQTNEEAHSGSHVSGGYREFTKAGYLCARNLFVKNPLLDDSRIMSYGTGRRRKMEDGLWWNRFFDPLYDSTDLDYLHVETPYAHGHPTPAKTEKLRYADFIQYSGPIAYRLGLFEPTLSADDKRTISSIENEISTQFDVSVDVESLLKPRVAKDKARRPLFDLLLRRVDPDVVLLTVSYSKETFVKSCKEHNIPVVEFQHGGFGSKHPGYVFPGDRTKTTFPDYLFVFGDLWKENIDFAIPEENVFAVGFPHLERQVRRYESCETRDQIVFISQRTIGPELSRFATELADDDRISSDIIYKLHPKEYDIWAETYPWLQSADVEVVDEDTPPLYRILSQSHTLVGVYSTVIYEGFNFGLDTYLFDTPGIAQMEWIMDLENVTVVESPDEFVELYRGETFDIDTTQFFADNPIQRIREALAEITGTDLRR